MTQRALNWVLTLAAVAGIAGAGLWAAQAEVAIAAVLLAAGVGLLLARAQLDGLVDIVAPTSRVGAAGLKRGQRAARYRPDMQTARAVALVVLVGVPMVATGVAPIADSGVVAANNQTIDNFDDGDLSEYSDDTGSATVQSNTAKSGSALELSHNGGITALESSSGLSHYPAPGDTYSFYTRYTSPGDIMYHHYGVSSSDSYVFTIRGDRGQIQLKGPSDFDATSNVPFETDVWYRVEIEWSSDGTHTAKVLNTNTGEYIAWAQITDDSLGSGGIKFRANNGNGNAGTVYYEEALIGSLKESETKSYADSFEDEAADSGVPDDWEIVEEGDGRYEVTTETAADGSQSVLAKDSSTTDASAYIRPQEQPYDVPQTGPVSASLKLAGADRDGDGTDAVRMRLRRDRSVFLDPKITHGHSSGETKLRVGSTTLASDVELNEWVDVEVTNIDPRNDTATVSWSSPNSSGGEQVSFTSSISGGYDDVALRSDDKGWWDDYEIKSSSSSIQGTVTDANGNPVQGASVKAINSSTGITADSGTTDSSGSVELSVDPGEYDVEATATIKETKTKTVDIPSGGETVDFTLRREKGSYTVKGADGTEITDRDVRIELYKVNNETINNEPRYFLDETDQSPVATGSGSSISFDKAEYGEDYIVAFRSDDGSKNQYRDLALPVAQVTGLYSLVLAPNTSVQQRVKIDDRTGGNWPSERVNIKAKNIDTGENRSRTALGSENLGTLWLNDSESYRIYAIRDDGAERRIGRLDAARETSDRPAVFDIRAPEDIFSQTDIQNRTATEVEPWSRESDIHYPPTAVADADNTSPVAGDSVTFDATDSEAYGDASISSYSWELPDDSTASGSTATWSSSSDDAGETATAAVTVEDSEGVRDTTQVTLYIAEDAADAAVPPAADATLETDDPVAGEPVVLSEAADTADGVTLESVEWDVDGDGEFEETGEKLEYQPDQSGLETVTIRVTDANGVSASRSISFFVGSDADSGLGFGGGSGGGVGGGPIGGGGGPSGSQQIALGVAGVGGYALWRRSGGPGVVALGRRTAPAVKRVGTSALSAVGTLARGTGRAVRKLVGAFT
ncbi:hypothetical protein BRD02_01565 [Halobacteriales archaeon QS_8_69_73]|nr:MAG: hypothetical protein BRD02_01565 [Halobacteriales archaeon QS_8_69_73]